MQDRKDRFTSLAVNRRTAELVEMFEALDHDDRVSMMGVALALKDGVEIPQTDDPDVVTVWVRESGYAARAEARMATS